MKRIVFVIVFVTLLQIYSCIPGCLGAVPVQTGFELLNYIHYTYYHPRITILQGSLRIQPRYTDNFQRSNPYPDMAADTEDSEKIDRIFARYKNFSESNPGEPIRYSEIHSEEYDLEHQMKDVSVGEQLLYNVGLLLLQMSAVELNRRY